MTKQEYARKYYLENKEKLKNRQKNYYQKTRFCDFEPTRKNNVKKIKPTYTKGTFIISFD